MYFSSCRILRSTVRSAPLTTLFVVGVVCWFLGIWMAHGTWEPHGGRGAATKGRKAPDVHERVSHVWSVREEPRVFNDTEPNRPVARVGLPAGGNTTMNKTGVLRHAQILNGSAIPPFETATTPDTPPLEGGPRFAYVWILGGSNDAAGYGGGIHAAISALRGLNAHNIHVTNGGDCGTSLATRILVADYLLLVPEGGDEKLASVVRTLRGLFTEVVTVPRSKASGYYYADHYLKLLLLGMYEGGPVRTRRGGYNRVMYLEGDYVVLRSLSHLFVQDFYDADHPANRLLGDEGGTVQEWDSPTEEQRTGLRAVLRRASKFDTLGGRCAQYGARRQFIDAAELGRVFCEGCDEARGGFLAMPKAYWLEAPCYMAGGPILVHPKQRLYDLYARPVMRCGNSEHPVFPDKPMCGVPRFPNPRDRLLCKETEMGYLNNVLLHGASSSTSGKAYDTEWSAVGRTLHEFYTMLSGEFIFQPPPKTTMRGYFTRNYFDNNSSRTLELAFGAHFAGPSKPWSPRPKWFGEPMEQLGQLLARGGHSKPSPDSPKGPGTAPLKSRVGDTTAPALSLIVVVAAALYGLK